MASQVRGAQLCRWGEACESRYHQETHPGQGRAKIHVAWPKLGAPFLFVHPEQQHPKRNCTVRCKQGQEARWGAEDLLMQDRGIWGGG